MSKRERLKSIRDEEFIYLTTTGRKTGKLHTVELWFAVGPAGVYLSHEGEPTDWMRNIKRNPRVSARIGELKFKAEARVVDSGEALKRGQRALYEKYYGPADKEIIDDWFSLSHVLLLQPLDE